jgi:hypothetical protein
MDSSLLIELDRLRVVDPRLFSQAQAWKSLEQGISYTETSGNFLAQASLSINYSSMSVQELLERTELMT